MKPLQDSVQRNDKLTFSMDLQIGINTRYVTVHGYRHAFLVSFVHFYIPCSNNNMMKACLVLLGLVCVAALKEDDRMEFMRAMDEVNNLKTLELLQKRLLLHAVPRRSLDENATVYESDLDLTQFAMKYVGCQNVKSFSDDLAEDSDSDTVLGYNRFVVFRLCPASKCSAYNKYGCQDSFGEYIIEMEMYLEIMSQYHHQKYLEYCATCITCMNPPNDDTLYTEYNSTTNETIYTWTAAGDCQYYNACQNYKQACKDYDANTDDSLYSQILGCSEYVTGNSVGYRGPHCGSNGKSITMGLFTDNECTKYIGNEADSGISSGSDDSLLQFFYNPTCVSCVNTVSCWNARSSSNRYQAATSLTHFNFPEHLWIVQR